MKIAALVMFKNEQTNLINCIDSVQSSVDLILGYDDHSRDDSKATFQSLGGELVSSEHDFSFGHGQEREIRNLLLDEARKRSATHFLFIDADEFFSDFLQVSFRDYCSQLTEGQKLLISWVNLALDKDHKYLDESPFGAKSKDFVVRDHRDLTYFGDLWSLHFGRTPKLPDYAPEALSLPSIAGVILHSQHLNRYSYDLKQAKYKCLELTYGTESAFQINDNTRFTLAQVVGFEELAPGEKHKYSNFDDNSVSNQTLLEDITQLFNTYGIKYFEKLEIWHLPILNNHYFATVGKKPREFRVIKFARKVWFKFKLSLKNFRGTK